ncbi:MAG: HU family DNA-binding protein [Deltaproteobacteria bacterium]|jgi:integration host factor subunit alpha|nr:HU family DNA-binding protein [Deltaproteobacteria bacterium]
MTVTKDSIARQISTETGHSAQASSELVDKILDVLKESMEKGNDILITGFGKFKITERPGRTVNNPLTKHQMVVKSRNVVTFRSSAKFRKDINKDTESES